MTNETSATQDWEARYSLLATLLRSLGTALLVAAGTVAVLVFVESWEGSPDLGVPTYLFWPMLAGASTLFLSSARLKALSPAAES